MARRTATQVEQAIETAVLAELAERGYRGVTYEGVARRASTSKPVLYRRFTSRPVMVLSALASSLHEQFPPDLHGPLREDLMALLAYTDDRVRAIGADTFRALVGEDDPQVLALLSGAIVAAERVLSEQVLAAAVERGELGPTPIRSASLRVPFAVLREQWLFRTDTALTLEEIVDTICLPLFRTLSTPPS